METETQKEDISAPSGNQSRNVEVELELVNMSPSPTPVVEECNLPPPTALIAPLASGNIDSTAERETYLNKNAGNGFQDTEEELKPLTLTAASNVGSGDMISPSPMIPKNRWRPGSSSDGTKVMMTGTVLQGSGGGTPVEVEVELSERELERLTSRESCKQNRELCGFGTLQGPHIILLSLVCIPVAFFISLCLSFYNGSITWYNLFIYFSEEKSVIYRLTLCPLLVLSFPVSVGLSTALLSIVASFIQISWSLVRWRTEILDGEKGFYGWLCNKMDLPDCSPYQVVILEDNNLVF